MAARIIRQEILSEPVTLDAVKLHLRLLPDDTEEDLEILLPLISAAREYAENYTGKAFATQRITVSADEDGTITLPRLPVIEIESVTADDKKVEYTANAKNGTVNVGVAGAEIVYTAGTQNVPFLARQAMLLLVGHWYANREAVTTLINVKPTEMELAVRAMLNQQKEWWF